MLKTAPLLRQPSVQALFEIWVNRYQSVTLDDIVPVDSAFLTHATSDQGRRRTVSTIKKRLIVSCERATLQTNSLLSKFASMDKHVHLADTRRLAQALAQVYSVLLEVYQQQPTPPIAIDYVGLNRLSYQEWAYKNAIQLSTIEQLIITLDPLLIDLQNQHLACRDSHTVGFLSTQFHFGAQILMERLSLVERMLLLPYFRFVEEQICIPWHRVCVAAARHSSGSPTFEAALMLMPQGPAIAEVVYQDAISAYPDHCSRRGNLRTPEVTASFRRDLIMFQAYFWLSVLEGDITALSEELLPLCLMVFPCISVDWDLVEHSVNTLMDEILNRFSLERQACLQPYANQMKALFAGARNRLPSPEPADQAPPAWSYTTY